MFLLSLSEIDVSKYVEKLVLLMRLEGLVSNVRLTLL